MEKPLPWHASFGPSLPAPPVARNWTPESVRLWIEQIVRLGAAGADDHLIPDPQLERTLRRRYAPHVHHLTDLIDRDLSAWLPSGADR